MINLNKYVLAFAEKDSNLKMINMLANFFSM